MNAEIVTRNLEAAAAPSFLKILLNAPDGESDAPLRDGTNARMAIDTFEGRRTATLEYTDHYILNRITVEGDGFRFQRFDLSDAAAQIADAHLSFEQIHAPDAADTIAEFFEETS